MFLILIQFVVYSLWLFTAAAHILDTLVNRVCIKQLLSLLSSMVCVCVCVHVCVCMCACACVCAEVWMWVCGCESLGAWSLPHSDSFVCENRVDIFFRLWFTSSIRQRQSQGDDDDDDSNNNSSINAQERRGGRGKRRRQDDFILITIITRKTTFVWSGTCFPPGPVHSYPMVGLKNGHILKNLAQNGEPQRYSWGNVEEEEVHG